MYKLYYILGLILCLTACQDGRKSGMKAYLKQWLGKEIIFPALHTYQQLNVKDEATEDSSSLFKLLHYANSEWCSGCRLQLEKWKTFIGEIESSDLAKKVDFEFYLSPDNTEELLRLVKFQDFHYPIHLDEEDSLDKLNNFPQDVTFHTFLLDKDNKVLAIGNPIHNPRVKALYMKIIRGGKQEKEQRNLTRVAVEKTSLDLGTFPWQEEQKTLFTLKNVGEHPLIIEGTTTSCDCTTVSYSKESVAPGNEVKLEVVYKAEKPEPFYRTISVYCNTPDAPIELEISGSAVE